MKGGNILTKHVDFEIESLEIVDENPDSQFATAKIRAFSSGANRHNMTCSEDVLRKTAPTIYNKPILYTLDYMKSDFNTHSDADRSLIAGFICPDSSSFDNLPDGRMSLNVLAKFWKRYSQKVIEIFKKSINGKKVSVEMELTDFNEDENGWIEMKDFIYSGVCLLGDSISEASPGANIQMLSFAKEKSDYENAYSLEFGRYDNLDFNISEMIKNNAIEGLNLYKKYNRGGNSVSLSLARHLSKGEKSNPDKIRYINKIFSGKRFDNIDKKLPSNSYINLMLYGGVECKDWVKEVCAKLDEIDNKDTRYFEELVTFPYTSLKDANPALKGIDPPITLEQANAIAKQADAIGSDKEKNGWAIAISSFKKTHIIKDGKWVKKDKNMSELNKIELNESIKEELSMSDEEKLALEKLEADKPKDTEENMAAAKPEDKEETPEEEKKETPEEEKKEEEKKDEEKGKKEEKMSLDANLDVAAIMAFLENETDEFKNVVAAEFAKPAEEISYATVCNAFYSKMCQMAEDMKTYMAENAELKKFKEDVEKAKFDFAVDATLKELEDAVEIPTKDLDEMKTRSNEFNLATIDAWKNECKAKAFSFAIKSKKENDSDGIKRFPNSWLEKSGKRPSVWENLG
jgi:hypothetical protein